MPIYEYKCTGCGHKKEVLQKMSDAPLIECPACGKPALTKLISAAGFQLKGSGWYATDFKGGSKSAKPGKDDGSPKVDSKSGDEGKTGGGDKATADSKAKGDDKPREDRKPREDSKPKEEAKSDKPASAGASLAGQ
ncbi:MAG TPA: FmdB family zinc ribbon protein [Burkholderiales bacterium]